MALHPGWTTNSASTALDARLRDAGTLTKNADGSVRTGVLWSAAMLTNVVADGQGTLSVIVRPGAFVLSKGIADGATILYNDGNVTVPLVSPVSAAQTQIVWVKQNDNTTGDAVSTPVFGATAGSTTTPTVAPAAPTGALVLATIYFSGAASNTFTTTNTPVYSFAAYQGAVIPFRNLTELRASTPEYNTFGKIIDGNSAVGTPIYVYQLTTGWRPVAGIAIAELQGNGSLANGAAAANRVAANLTATGSTTTDAAVIALTSPTSVTCVLAGKYRVSHQSTHTASSTGVRVVELLVNGASLLTPLGASANGVAAIDTWMGFSQVITVAANSVLTFNTGQSSGASNGYSTRTQIEFLA